MSDRTDTLRGAFAALDRGAAAELESLFAPDAQWLGVPGTGVDGSTPI